MPTGATGLLDLPLYLQKGGHPGTRRGEGAAREVKLRNMKYVKQNHMIHMITYKKTESNYTANAVHGEAKHTGRNVRAAPQRLIIFACLPE